MKKDTIIFDLDGTLLDTLEDLYQSVIYTQNLLHYREHTKSQVRQHLGNGIKVLMKKSLPEGAAQEEVERAFAICQQYYGEHSLDATKPYDGIIQLLKELKEAGCKLAIVSNKPDFAVKELNQHFFSDYISIAIGENEAAGIRKKPAPDSLLKAVSLLDSTVEQSIYIGDSEVDIQTAANASMDLILCEWGFRDRDDLERQGGRIFVQKPGDIKKHI